MKTDISIVIPMYNESENVDGLCEVIDSYAQTNNFSLEVIFVNDGSTDNTESLLQEYKFSECINGKIISLSHNSGSHAAIRAGLSVATSEYSMLFSGDLQEPVNLIGLLYNKIKEGYDIVYVEKGMTKVSKSEMFFSSMFAKLISKYAVPNFPKGGVNDFMITSKVRDIFVANPEPNSSIFLQLMTMGFSHTFIICDYNERAKGISKWTTSKKIKAFIDSFVSFSYAPIRAVTVVGILLSVAALLCAIYIIIMKLIGITDFDPGFPTLIAVLLIGFGLTNISLGIIAEYLSRTLDAARGRPVYIIDRIIDLREGNESLR